MVGRSNSGVGSGSRVPGGSGVVVHTAGASHAAAAVAADNEWLSSDETKKNFIAKYQDGCQIGLYGWRRKCLFLVLTILLFLVVVNLALTLWILKVMEFSSTGLGPLKVVPGGIQLNGEAMILDKLIASRIRSRKDQPVRIESSKNISLIARGVNGKVFNKLVLGNDMLECQTSKMEVTDRKGKLIFAADKEKVVMGADLLQVTGEGGAIFHGSLQTPLVKSDTRHELRLESPTRCLNIKGGLGITISSRAGDISATCLTELKLLSKAGTIQLEAPNIYFPKLRTSLPSAKLPVPASSQPTMSSAMKTPDVYQVCLCEKGRLFLAPPEGDCIADNDVCR